ncbi:hypothetical protein F7725_025768 [Dissostichus mawsoni]|uniref:Uncharacterized protein n=1 Tax=Dissostichus mawsoni TaxID=36200 RepID=A0A7J5X5L1_DISMA|nr:hypothetical protein F7725_025768 [Dissostichus mawsoni]
MFVSNYIVTAAPQRLHSGDSIILAGGFDKGEEVKSICTAGVSSLTSLYSDQDADTRMVLHAIHLAESYSRIIVRSDDTDVEVLLIYYASKYMFEGCVRVNGSLKDGLPHWSQLSSNVSQQETAAPIWPSSFLVLGKEQPISFNEPGHLIKQEVGEKTFCSFQRFWTDPNHPFTTRVKLSHSPSDRPQPSIHHQGQAKPSPSDRPQPSIHHHQGQSKPLPFRPNPTIHSPPPGSS